MKTSLTTIVLLFIVSFTRSQNVTQLEYFIDKDKGFGKNTKVNVDASTDSTYSFLVDLTGLKQGYHKLYIRAKDSKGKWSITARRNIEVIPQSTSDSIIAGEYFFDIDPGIGKANKITITQNDSAVIQDFVASTSNLSAGYHKLYMRFKDTYNHWSMTVRRNAEVIKTLDTTDIAAAEYFFSNDPGLNKATQKTFAKPLPDGSFTFKIAYNKIPSDADTLFIRTIDSNGYWSLTKLAKFTVAPPQNSMIVTAANSAMSDHSNTFNVSVSPNPAKEIINVNIHNIKAGSIMLQLYNMSGKALFEKRLIAKGNITTQLNLSNLPAGMYMLNIDNGEEKQIKKIIKE